VLQEKENGVAAVAATPRICWWAMKDSNLQPPDEEEAASGRIISGFQQLAVQNTEKCSRNIAPFAPYLHPGGAPERTLPN